jgi:hypothetical protein
MAKDPAVVVVARYALHFQHNPQCEYSRLTHSQDTARASTLPTKHGI